MITTFQYNRRAPLLYVLNNLESLEFGVDLWELFGSEDNFQKGLVGKWNNKKGEFSQITWDWPISNMRHIFNIFYLLFCGQQGKHYRQEEFDKLYEHEIKSSEDLVESLVKVGLSRPFQALYVMKYKKQFPALLINWDKIEVVPGRKRKLLISFTPVKYFVLDPDSWYNMKTRSKNLNEWTSANLLAKEIKEDFTGVFQRYLNMKQVVYGLLPWHIIYDEMKNSKTVFFKSVQTINKMKVVSDNAIFWALFYHFTGASRARYNVRINNNYTVENIPIDAFDEKASVYKHEAGVANTLSHALMDVFKQKYLDVEFGTRSRISYKEANVLLREFKVGSIEGEENNEYKDSDYDFALNLQALGIKCRMLVDLTTALWRKGLLDYDSYMKRWKETCINIPMRHHDCLFIWYILVNETEKNFFEKSPPNKLHQNFDMMLKDLIPDKTNQEPMIISRQEDIRNYSGQRIIILKLFKTSPQSNNVIKELNGLLQDYRNTTFYNVCFSVLSYLNEPRNSR